jgi:hypothetical protein
MYWIKPHADGTLFSNSDPREYQGGEVYYAEIIENGKYGYVNTLETKYLFDNTLATFFEWQNVMFEVHDFDEMFGSPADIPPPTVQGMVDGSYNSLYVYLDGVVTDSVTMCEFPVGNGNRSHFGAIEEKEVMKDWFKGFLWKIESEPITPATDWSTDGSSCSGVCDRCPSDNGSGPDCLGICDFDYYWADGRCNHCPYWCREGCQSDGGC